MNTSAIGLLVSMADDVEKCSVNEHYYSDLPDLFWFWCEFWWNESSLSPNSDLLNRFVVKFGFVLSELDDSCRTCRGYGEIQWQDETIDCVSCHGVGHS